MEIVNLSKKRLQRKRSGRFKIQIDTLPASNPMYVQYEITVSDLGNPDFVRVKTATYTGSNPYFTHTSLLFRLRRIHYGKNEKFNSSTGD